MFNSSDPFSKARQMQDSRQSMDSQVTMENPFEGLMDPQVPGAVLNQPGPQNSMNLQSAMSPERILDQNSLMDALSKIGLDNSKISFTPVGKMMMNQQFQKKFGTDYMSNKEVNNLVSSFDDIMQKNPITAAKQKNQQENSTNRILGFLGR